MMKQDLLEDSPQWQEILQGFAACATKLQEEDIDSYIDEFFSDLEVQLQQYNISPAQKTALLSQTQDLINKISALEQELDRQGVELMERSENHAKYLQNLYKFNK